VDKEPRAKPFLYTEAAQPADMRTYFGVKAGRLHGVNQALLVDGA
jgi:hypothetical protein